MMRAYSRIIQLIIILSFFNPYLLVLKCSEDEIIMDVPFVKQREHYDCAVVALMSLLEWKGIKVGYDEVKDAVYSEGAKGVFPISIEIFLRKKNISYRVVESQSRILEELLGKRIPSIVFLERGIGGLRIHHYYVVVGMKRNKVIVHDGSKPFREMDKGTFMRRWSKSNYWLLYIE